MAEVFQHVQRAEEALIMRAATLLLIATLCTAASCKTLPEDKSAFAAVAGQSTIVLGACSSDFKLGWEQCLLERGSSTFPTLRFVMTNPGEWAVGDCELGIYRTGAVNQPGLVEVPLDGLRRQAEQNGFCVLKIEAVERYPDPNDSNQLRSIPLRGGFFLELIQPGYMPVPSNDVVAFCVKVGRTTKGRTKIEKCTN